MITRRTMVGGLLVAITAPAIVKASSLMPVKVMDWRQPWLDLVFANGRELTIYSHETVGDVITRMIAENGEARLKKIYDQMGSHHLVADFNNRPVVKPTLDRELVIVHHQGEHSERTRYFDAPVLFDRWKIRR